MMYSKMNEPLALFERGDATGAPYYRIPFLWRSSKDTLIAGTDANFGSTGDSAENIDVALRVKRRASEQAMREGWDLPYIPEQLHYKDYTDELGYRQTSASLIDGCIVEDRLHTGRLLLLIDLWAWNGGLFQYLGVEADGEKIYGERREVAGDDGFCTIGERRYLLLSTRNIMGSDGRRSNVLNRNVDRSQFDLVADVYGVRDARGHYVIYHLEGQPGTTSADDRGLGLGQVSSYRLNQDYDLYRDGEPLSVRRRKDDETYTDEDVPMKVFYKDSHLQVYNTSYLLQFVSEDDGASWQTDRIITGGLKSAQHSFYILGPGRGIQVEAGAYRGRLIVPIYYVDLEGEDPGKQQTAVIYSDDGGGRWAMGGTVPSATGLSEAAPVEGHDGTLLMFVRNTGLSGGKVALSRSEDGGLSWSEAESALGDAEEGVNCQVSALRLNRRAADPRDPEGARYPVVALLSAMRRERKHGVISLGLLKEDQQLLWVDEIEVAGPDALFGYSCMAELEDGRLAVLYESSEDERWSSGLQRMYYTELEPLG